MAPHDEHDFVDREYEKAQGAWSEPERLAVDSDASSMATAGSAREQLDAKFGSTQQRLLALKQEQEKLESERVALEELRRRRSEYVRGRDEMIGHLARGHLLLGRSPGGCQTQWHCDGRIHRRFSESSR